MGSDYGIDSHKLIYHVDRVHDWMSGKTIYPLYMEVAPAGGCNHRCIFCGLDYMGHKYRLLPFSCWPRFVNIAAKKGVRSILFSGEGEPLLNPDTDKFISLTKSKGVDVALASNGVLLTKSTSEKCLKHLTWLRISLDAGTPKTYGLIHGTKGEQFGTVIGNLEDAVLIKKRGGYPVTIGVQFLLLGQNKSEVEKAILLARKIGINYFSVKPYSKHPLSINSAGREVDYSETIRLAKKLSQYSTKTFSVIVRTGAMKRKCAKKPYDRCLGLPFWGYVASSGDVYPCSTFLGLKKYCVGNICTTPFSSIWEGKLRAQMMKRRFAKMDATQCRELCRLDEINAYLWKLTHPSAHVNFI